MKFGSQRKLTRFYIINPVGDRRMEQRFESREDVVVRFPESGKVVTAVAYEIGRTGLRLETEAELPVGADIEVAFPRTSDHIRCFGQVAWSKGETAKHKVSGVAVDAWHGVVLGEGSWSRYKGAHPKKDRRNSPR